MERPDTIFIDNEPAPIKEGTVNIMGIIMTAPPRPKNPDTKPPKRLTKKRVTIIYWNRLELFHLIQYELIINNLTINLNN
jgi:hypothetical protein